MQLHQLLNWLQMKHPGVRFLDGRSLYLQGNPFAQFKQHGLWYSIDGAAWNQMKPFETNTWTSAGELELQRMLKAMYYDKYQLPPLSDAWGTEQKEVIQSMPQYTESEAQKKGFTFGTAMSTVFSVRSDMSQSGLFNLGFDFAELFGMQGGQIKAWAGGFMSAFSQIDKAKQIEANIREIELS